MPTLDELINEVERATNNSHVQHVEEPVDVAADTEEFSDVSKMAHFLMELSKREEPVKVASFELTPLEKIAESMAISEYLQEKFQSGEVQA